MPPFERLILAIPRTCVRCNAVGAPHLLQSHRGTTVRLNWVCRVCGAEWQIDPLSTDGSERSPAVPHSQ
jgi:hypothetical protein